MVEQQDDERAFVFTAGTAAILSGCGWILWTILNGVTHGKLDAGPPQTSERLFKFGELLTVSWNLLLIPAALALWRWLSVDKPNLVLLYTISGITSLLFWSFGGATHRITPALETTYVLLSSIWWLGIGFALVPRSRALGIFSVVLGSFALMDGIFTILEPMPFGIYVLAAPKLPLAALWSFWIGKTLLSRNVVALAGSGKTA
jgi:hypothetical protein